MGVYRNKSRGGVKISAKRKIFFFPLPIGAPRGGQNLNCKFKIFGFLDIRLNLRYFKLVYIQSNHLESKDIFENEKLNLNLNSMMKKRTKVQKIIMNCKSFCCEKSRSTIVIYIIKLFVHVYICYGLPNG